MKKQIIWLVIGLLLRGSVVSMLAQKTTQGANPNVNPDIIVTAERNINSALQDYSPAFFENGLVFISSNPAARSKNEDGRTGSTTTSIFLARRTPNGKLDKPLPFAQELTTNYYDGPLTFDARAERIFFTRSNLRFGKPEPGRDGKVKLKIYTADRKQDGLKTTWGKLRDLPFNSNEYDCAHPAISVDGEWLFFASNRGGGYGGMDLYVCVRRGDSWGAPMNLGPQINTAKDELFPFIHADGTLFFASSGHVGKGESGGLDIFYTRPMDTAWATPQALPQPLNSPFDDFGFIVDSDQKNGYFSSNRPGGTGDDDIYHFFAPTGLRPQPKKAFEITLQTAERGSGRPLGFVEVTYYAVKSSANTENEAATEGGGNGRILRLIAADSGAMALASVTRETARTDENGVLTIKSQEGIHVFDFYTRGYLPKRITKTLQKKENRVLALLQVEKADNVNNVKPNKTGMDVEGVDLIARNTISAGTVLQMPNIYYHYNDVDLRPDARTDLDILLQVMKKYKGLKIQISSHTDARGAVEYNLKLSQQRADNILEYLSSNGIERNRMQAVGYGEMYLKNHCSDGIPCTESQHRANRRTEIKVLQSDVSLQTTPFELLEEQQNGNRPPLSKPAKTPTATPPSPRKAEPKTEIKVEPSIPSIETMPPPQHEDEDGAKEEVKIEPEPGTKPIIRPESRVEVRPTKPNPKPDITPEPQPEVKKIVNKEPTKEATAEKPLKKEELPPLKIPKKERPKEGETWFLIVIGTYSSMENAALQLQKAQKEGFSEAEIIEYTQNKLMGVCIQRFKTRAEADKFVKSFTLSHLFTPFIKEYKF